MDLPSSRIVAAVAGVALAACASATSSSLRYASTRIDDQQTAYRFTLDDGCMEFAMPSSWVRLDQSGFTSFHTPEEGGRIALTVNVFSSDLKPGAALRETALARLRMVAEANRKQAEKLGSKYGVDADLTQGMTMDESRLEQTRLGVDPDAREAMTYTARSYQVREKTGVFIYSKMNAMGVTRQSYDFLSGGKLITFVFVGPQDLWAGDEPLVQSVRSSIRFMGCKPS